MYVRAVRGAVTVENNTSQEILNETMDLLKRIVEANCIDIADIASAVFSVTKDLNAVFPAAAARMIGWTDIALMCTNEIDVPGSLEKCIRVMVTFNTTKKNNELKHIFLKGAKVLRPDIKD